MKIVLATPLYPPDVTWPAPYIKELARRLSPAHEISIVTYGDLPEQVEGVEIVSISKRVPRLMRLMRYTRALLKAAGKADVIYAENGPSVELPLVVASFVSRTPIIFHTGDERARVNSQKSAPLRALYSAAQSSAKKAASDSPLPRPEILPLDEYPTNEMAAYEASWQKHLEALEDLFTYARQ